MVFERNLNGIEVILRIDNYESPSKHTFGDWTVTQRPTSNRDGEKERICQICQY